MRCPFCGSAETKVIDSRFNEDSYSIKRRRECIECQSRFNTLETSELNYPRVIKSDDSSEVFNETKVRRGVNRAFEKRKITIDQIDELIQKVLTKCSQYPNKEIPSTVIGETIMSEMILIDQVAYLRFASVYLRFDNVNSFKKIIENLEKQPSPRMIKNQKKINIDE
jgi:transcriptional repressor NrdR